MAVVIPVALVSSCGIPEAGDPARVSQSVQSGGSALQGAPSLSPEAVPGYVHGSDGEPKPLFTAPVPADPLGIDFNALGYTPNMVPTEMVVTILCETPAPDETWVDVEAYLAPSFYKISYSGGTGYMLRDDVRPRDDVPSYVTSKIPHC